jgi:DNA invertase Pin-like site-specific DNA recombinase
LGKAVGACQKGKASGIIVAFQDRLSREDYLGTAEVWTALDKSASKLVCAAEGGEMKRTEFVFKAEFARLQWERYQENWRNTISNRRRRGGYHGGSRTPAGYRKGEGGRLEVDPEAAAVIEEAYKLRGKGVSYKDVGAYMTEHGVTAPSGNWSAQAVQKLLRNPLYCGDKVAEGHRYPGIVSRPVWRAAQPGKAKGDYAFATSLFQGLLVCAGCGRKMTPTRGPKGQQTYGCRTSTNTAQQCPSPAVVSESVLEEWLVEQIPEQSPEELEADAERAAAGLAKNSWLQALVGGDADRARLERELQAAQAAYDDVAAVLKTTVPETSEPALRLREAQEALEALGESPASPQLESRIREMFSGAHVYSDREMWTHSPLEVKRELFLKSRYAGIRVSPAGRGHERKTADERLELISKDAE